MFRPSHLQAYLDQIGASAKKSLSQNFLIDGNILKKIVVAADLHEGDLVLEIGPGPGALTEQMLLAGAYVTAVEKDRLFAKYLAPHERLSLLEMDILDFDFSVVKGRTKIVANLPYHLTSPILEKFIPRADLFSSMTVMVQHEVAVRMCALPGSSDYSSLSVFLQYFGNPRYAFKVSRRSFSPAPKVDSAVVVIAMRETSTPPGFFPFVKKAFQQKRKMISSSLSSYNKDKIKCLLRDSGYSSEARPAELSAAAWLELYQKVVHT